MCPNGRSYDVPMISWSIDLDERLAVAVSRGAPDAEHFEQYEAMWRELARIEAAPHRPLLVLRFRHDPEPAARSVREHFDRLVAAGRFGSRVPGIGLKQPTFMITVISRRIDRVMVNAWTAVASALLDVPIVTIPIVPTWDDARAIAEQLRGGPLPRLALLRSEALTLAGIVAPAD